MRKAIDWLLLLTVALCAVIALGTLATVVAVIVGRGWPALSWSFFIEQIRLVGAAGGIFWNLVGTLVLVATAFLAAAPIATGLALLEHVWLHGSRAKRGLRTFLYTLNGLPSILFGIAGFLVFSQWCGWGKSWLAGGLVLALMIVPTVTIALIERLEAVPPKYVEAGAALGLNSTQLIWAVLLPQSWGGLITGSLLGLARAAGETAPIMFTATIFAGATFPQAIKESPVLTLPYHIFILAQDSFDPNVGTKLWGAALVLLGLVFCLSLAALPGRLRLHEEASL